MTIESTTSAVKGGVAKRFAALFVAAATLLAGGVFSVSAAPSALADDAETNVALNAEKGAFRCLVWVSGSGGVVVPVG